MKKELKELKLTKDIIIPFPNFQENTIISPVQINDNFEEIEYAYNNLIDNHNGAISKIEDAIKSIPLREELIGDCNIGGRVERLENTLNELVISIINNDFENIKSICLNK